MYVVDGLIFVIGMSAAIGLISLPFILDDLIFGGDEDE